MRKILVGVMVAVVAVAGPAVAGMTVVDEPAPQVGGRVHFTNPTERVIIEHDHGPGAEFGLAVAASAINLVYTPFRFVFGVVGAGLGGFGGWTTGGDMRTAKGIWRPTTEGHYFMRPDYLDGTERFRFSGAVPERREALVVTHEAVVAPEEIAPAPVEPAPYEDEDDAGDAL